MTETTSIAGDQRGRGSPPIHVSADHLRSFTRSAAVRAGVAAEDIELFVSAIVEANLRGVDSHGVFRLPFYIRALLTKAVNPTPAIKVVRARGATQLIDADNGLGLIVGQRAMDRAIALAASSGVGICAVRNSNHSGMLAVHVLRATTAGMIGHFVSNAPALMAPWGGREPLLSNSPFAWSVPSRSQPIVLDMACSAVARGRIRLAAQNDEVIPAGWAVDADGLPTQDARSAMKGVVLPMAGHKGYSIAFILEILGAALPGAALSMDVSRAFLSDDARAIDAWGVGHLAMAIDPDAFGEVDAFLDAIDRLSTRMRTSVPAVGSDGVMVPGDPEWRLRRERVTAGIPLSRPVMGQLTAFAEEIGIEPLEVHA